MGDRWRNVLVANGEEVDPTDPEPRKTPDLSINDIIAAQPMTAPSQLLFDLVMAYGSITVSGMAPNTIVVSHDVYEKLANDDE